jgi:hypothetical protein
MQRSRHLQSPRIVELSNSQPQNLTVEGCKHKVQDIAAISDAKSVCIGTFHLESSHFKLNCFPLKQFSLCNSEKESRTIQMLWLRVPSNRNPDRCRVRDLQLPGNQIELE